jgi:hypothetical protein
MKPLTGIILLLLVGYLIQDPVRKLMRLRQVDLELAHWNPSGQSADTEKRVAMRRERDVLSDRLQYLTHFGIDVPQRVAAAPAPVAVAQETRNATIIVAPAPEQPRFVEMSRDADWRTDSSRNTTTGGQVRAASRRFGR